MEFDNSYISKLYDGQINPLETLVIKTNEFKECERKIKSINNELKEILTEEQYKKIEQLAEHYNFKSAQYADKGFEEGFKHGVILMTSVFKATTEGE